MLYKACQGRKAFRLALTGSYHTLLICPEIPCWVCHMAINGGQGACSLRLPLRETEGGILTEGEFTHKIGLDRILYIVSYIQRRWSL